MLPLIRSVLLVASKTRSQEKLRAQLIQLQYQVDQVENIQLGLHQVKIKPYVLIVVFAELLEKSAASFIYQVREYEGSQSIPLIVCTDEINPLEEQFFLKLGADILLRKSITQKSLNQALQDCFFKPGYRRKFYFQMRMIQKELQTFPISEKKATISTYEEREFVCQLRYIAKKILQITDEYQQWLAF